MWNISGWIRRRRMARRDLLRFWDGTCHRYGDPYLLWRRLAHHPTVTLDEDLWEKADNGDEPEATTLVETIAEVFEVQRFDGKEGLTDWEIISLYVKLMDYLEEVKKKLGQSPTSLPPTESESSTAQEAADSSETCGLGLP